MPVIGIDLGTDNCVVAVGRRGGINVLSNEFSRRYSPTVISFGDKTRHVGEAGVSQLTFNAQNTVMLIKRLIGLRYSEIPASDLEQIPCKITQGPNDSVLAEVEYKGEKCQFTPVQILAMMFTQLGKYVEAEELSVEHCDVVIAIPVHFLDAQRRAVLQAARIAGLNVVKLVNDACAAAVEYGIYKDLPENQAFNVAFVDVGHADTTVSIVELKHDQVKVLANAFDRFLGARDFEQILVNFFIDEVARVYGMDVRSNHKALMRLQKECDRLKKILSVNPVVQLRIECFMNDKDINLQITREQFEKMAESLHARFEVPVRKALADCKIDPKSISSVEVFGGASYIPALRHIISEVFQQPVKTTLNATETIAKGAAITAGMMSTSMHLAKKFAVVDSIHFPISCGWVPAAQTGDAMDIDAGEGVVDAPTLKSSLVFKKFDPTPNTKMLTFKRSSDFDLYLTYAEQEDLPQGTNPIIGRFTISKVPKRDTPLNVKVTIKHNTHGIVGIVEAHAVEEIEVEEQEEIKEEPAPATEQPAANTEAEAKDNAAPAQPAEKKYRTVKKKKTIRTDLVVTPHVQELSEKEIAQFIGVEQKLRAADREVAETEEAKNAVEAYIYQMKDKIFDEDALGKFVEESARDEFEGVLTSAEDWLYDEGEFATKQQSQQKLAELQKIGNPIENRKREYQERPTAINHMLDAIQEYKDFVTSTDERYSHISQEDRAKVANKIAETEEWLRENMNKQSSLKDTQDPILTVYNINLKTNELRSFARPIVNKPKPVPPKEEPKKEEKPAEQPAQQEEQKSDEKMDTNE